MKRLSLLAVLVVSAFAPLSSQAPRNLVATRELLVTPDVADLSSSFNMAVSPHGDIAIGQPNDGHIKLFSTTGAMRTIGRKGEGPGEFRRVSRVGFKGDTLWAIDLGTARISYFAPGYRYVRSVLEPELKVKGVDMPGIQAVLPSGDLRFYVNFRTGATPPAWAPTDSGITILARFSPDGDFRNVLAIFQPDGCSVAKATEKSVITRIIPFCARQLSTQFDGTAGVAALEVSGRRYKVVSLGAHGDTLFARDFPFAPIPVSRGALDTLAEQEVRLKKMQSPQTYANSPKVTPAKTFPPVRELVLGRDGTVWLELRTTTGGHTWLMLDPKGNPVGTVVLPNEVTMKVAERGTVWGFVTDDDGLKGVVRYRVSR